MIRKDMFIVGCFDAFIHENNKDARLPSSVFINILKSFAGMEIYGDQIRQISLGQSSQ